MQDRLETLEKEVAAIKQRNQKVQADKAWEQSPTRLLSIALMTYVIACTALYFIRIPDFYLSALVPVIGFILSTRSLPFVKRWWIERCRKIR